MNNLAGNKNCDKEIRRELQRAKIEIFENLPARGEVPATLQGKLGPIIFTRYWNYWVADGPVSIEVARKLYEDPVGRTDIRSGGHCGCPSPDEYGADYFNADGFHLQSDPDGTKQRDLENEIASGRTDPSDLLFRYVPDKRKAAVKATVRCYHIDSEVGLRIFADHIRSMADS